MLSPNSHALTGMPIIFFPDDLHYFAALSYYLILLFESITQTSFFISQSMTFNFLRIHFEFILSTSYFYFYFILLLLSIVVPGYTHCVLFRSISHSQKIILTIRVTHSSHLSWYVDFNGSKFPIGTSCCTIAS